MMRILAMSVVLGLAACAAQPAEQVTPMNESLPAPTPPEITLRISGDQAGTVVTAPVGGRFAVELIGVPTAGYVWEAVGVPSFLAPAGETSGPTTAAQNQPGFAGGQHWEVLAFDVKGPGMGDLRLEQRRPWETSEPPAQTFTITIDAR